MLNPVKYRGLLHKLRKQDRNSLERLTKCTLEINVMWDILPSNTGWEYSRRQEETQETSSSPDQNGWTTRRENKRIKEIITFYTIEAREKGRTT